jgi:hypothetical protein
MSDGDEESSDSETEIDAETLGERLDAVEAELEAAETEADLDSVEADLEDAESDLEASDIPEGDEDDDEEGPREELQGRIDDLRSQLEDERGPYAEDVIAEVESVQETIDGTRWTETGEAEVTEAVDAFTNDVEGTLGVDVDGEGVEESLVAALEAIDGADLDPDEDEETIAALVDAAEGLSAGVDDAEEWEDLTTREKLDAHGFYDVLDHTKDYPPEWHALKVYEKRAEVEPILLALDMLDANFMEEHCLDALRKLGDEAAVEPMLERAEKRDKPAIEILGKIGSDEALDTILEYVDTPSDPLLQKTTLKAVGEIGSEEATGTVADQLVAENEEVRSYAARTLGRIGDTRAIEPLADVLEDDDSDTVRASAAWALVQIGTERALSELEHYSDDRAYLVQSEAEKAL